MKGWNLFSIIPYEKDAPIFAWGRFLAKHFAFLVRILAYIPDDYSCLLCSNPLKRFKNRQTLSNHISGGHWSQVTAFWIEKGYLKKSPRELFNQVYYTKDGSLKFDGVVLNI